MHYIRAIKGYVTELYGKPNVGKTHICINDCYLHALYKDKVLFISLGCDEKETVNRFKMINGYDEYIASSYLDIIGKDMIDNNIISLIESGKYEYIYIDSLREIENVGFETNYVLELLGNIARKNDISIIITDYYQRQNVIKKSIQSIASLFRKKVDNYINMFIVAKNYNGKMISDVFIFNEEKSNYLYSF